MRIGHRSDSHLGWEHGEARTPQGYNVRGEDVIQAHADTVPTLLDAGIDMLLDTGDETDDVVMPARILERMLNAAHLIAQAKIPQIHISGNHTSPKQPRLGDPLLLLRHVPNCFIVTGGPAAIKLNGCSLHCIPWTPFPELYAEWLRTAQPDSTAKWNVLATHGSVIDLKVFSYGKGPDCIIPNPQTFLDRGFDAVCLGHYHVPTDFAPLAQYSGSLERLSWGEQRLNERRVVVLDLDRQTRESLPLSLRPMLDLGSVTPSGESPADLVETVLAAIRRGVPRPMGAMVRIKLAGVRRSAWEAADWRAVEQALALREEGGALSFERIPEWAEDEPESPAIGETAYASLAEEWRAWGTARELPEPVVDIGHKELEAVETER